MVTEVMKSVLPYQELHTAVLNTSVNIHKQLNVPVVIPIRKSGVCHRFCFSLGATVSLSHPYQGFISNST